MTNTVIKVYRGLRHVCTALQSNTDDSIYQVTPELDFFRTTAEWRSSLKNALHYTHVGDTLRVFHSNICLATAILYLPRYEETPFHICQIQPYEKEFSNLHAWMAEFAELSYQQPVQDEDCNELAKLVEQVKIC